MSLIKGIHHVSMKCSSTEEYEKTIDFYKNILGIPVAREWQAGIMLDTGNGIVEIFNDGDDAPGKGVIRHFAFATDNVDACVEAGKTAGYGKAGGLNGKEVKNTAETITGYTECIIQSV